MIPAAALLQHVAAPTCHRCGLFVVNREGAACEVCRRKIGHERNAAAVRAAWARKRASKETSQ